MTERLTGTQEESTVGKLELRGELDKFPAMMRSKVILAATFAVLSLGAVVRAGDTPPLEKCVVNGDLFSEHHHAPVQVSYKGQTMFVCCKMCARKFDKDPEKYLKLWEQALKAKAAQATK